MNSNVFTNHGLILSGIKGQPGPQGLRGIAGPAGPSGSPHPDPIIGLQGPQGPSGENGLPGIKGPCGQPGDIGQEGIIGIPGLIGEDGIDGPKGYPGESGSSGQPGTKGFLGMDGSIGPIGASGESGTSWWYNQPLQFANDENDINDLLNPSTSINNFNNNFSSSGANSTNSFNANSSNTYNIINNFNDKFSSSGAGGAINIINNFNNKSLLYHDQTQQWRVVAESESYDGPIGIDGISGFQGPIGDIGLSGYDGLPGEIGPMGPDETVYNIFYVDNVYGNDATAERGRRAAPFATCKSAMEQASQTDTILVLNGHHRISNLNKNNITWYLSAGVIMENIGDNPLFNGNYINILGYGTIISKSYSAIDITTGSAIRIEAERILTVDCPAITISSGCRAKIQLQEIDCRGHSPAIINQGMLYFNANKIFSDIDSCLVLLEGHSVIKVNYCQSTSLHKAVIGIFGGSNYLDIDCIQGCRPITLASTVHNIWAKCIISSIIITKGQKPIGIDVQRVGLLLNNDNESEVIGGNIDVCMDVDQVSSEIDNVCGLQQLGGLVHIQCNSIKLSGNESVGVRVISGVLSASVSSMNINGTLGYVQRDAALSFVGQDLTADDGWIFTNNLPSQLNIQILTVNNCNVLVDRPNDDNPLHLQIQYLGNETSIGVDHRRGYVISQISNLRGSYRQSGGRALLNVGQYFTQLDSNSCLFLTDGECRLSVGMVQHKGQGSCFDIQGGRLWINAQTCVSQGSLAHLSSYQNSHWSVNSARCNVGWIIENGQTVINVLDLECNDVCWKINKGYLDIYSTKVVGKDVIEINDESQVSYKTLHTSAQNRVIINNTEYSEIYLQGEFKSLSSNTIELNATPKKIIIMQGVLFTAEGETNISGTGLVHNLNSLVCNKTPITALANKNLQLIK